MASKRPRGTPTGKTPSQPSKRSESTVSKPRGKSFVSRRKLTYAGISNPKESEGDDWTRAEYKALVEFLLLTSDGSTWEWSKKTSYWESASQFLLKRCGTRKSSE